MKEFFILISPYLWSLKNDFIRMRWGFLKKFLLYAITGIVLIILITRLLNAGILELQSISKELTEIILTKAYSLVFLIILFIQIINGFTISLGTFYNSGELEPLIVSPVNRISLFLSRLLITHIKTTWMLIVFGFPLIISLGTIHNARFYYYLTTPPLLFLFSVIAVNIGVLIASILASAIHVMRLKRFLITTGIVSIAVLITLFRLLRPERFVNPEFFASLTIFISEIKTPSFILLPNRWLVESIFRLLKEKTGVDLFLFISILMLTSYLTLLIVILALKRFHYRGWEIIHKGEGLILKRRSSLNWLHLIKFPVPFRRDSLELIKKELILQIRNPENIQNSVVILSLIIIYIFSISALPLNWKEYGLRLRYTVAFLNLGMIMIIITSITSRIVFPAVVSEKEQYWLLRTSPLMPQKYISSKFLIYLMPVSFTGLFLIIITSIIIGLERTFILIEAITITTITPPIISMAIYYGIYQNRDKEASKISTAYLIASAFLILTTMGIEVIPAFLYFLREKMGGEFSMKGILMIAGSAGAVIIINSVITAISLRKATKRFNSWT